MDNKKTSTVLKPKTIFKGLRIAISVSLLFSAGLILMTLDQEALQKALSSISPRIIFELMILLTINFISAGFRFKIMVKTTGNNISLLDGIILYLAGSFISNVTPMATGGGPFQVYFLHKRGINIGQGTMVVLTQFIFRIFFFTAASIIFLFFFRWAISPGILPDYLFYLAFGIGFLITTSLIIFSIVPGSIKIMIGWVFKINYVRNFTKNNYWVKRLLAKGRIELREFHNSMKLLIKHKMKVMLAGLSTLVYWTSLFMIIPIILKGLGYDPHYFRSYVMQTIFNLVIPYMPTPGASGIAEVGFASLFISFIPRGIIGIVTFLWRFTTFYLILLIGGFFAMRELGWKRRKEN